MDKLRILVVEDEKEIADLIEIYLSNEGYHIIKAYDSEQAFAVLNEQKVDLILLDIMLPGVDGIQICRNIRKDSNVPIIMVSAKSEDIDKIMGLSTGADDYITKPFNPLELIARVKSQLRRYIYLNPQSTANSDENIININHLIIDSSSHTVSLYGREVNLTPTEFEILFLLVSNRGRVFSTEEIFEKVWKEQYYEAKNTVMVHIRKIREKIEEDPRKPRFIKTVWGVGYKIEK